MEAIFETLIKAAVQAPSGDNVQPWRFVVDGDARKIAIYLDESRDPSPMNAAQRMSRLAIGAALENLLRAVESLGWKGEIEQPRDDALVLIGIDDAKQTNQQIDPLINTRVTNRRQYDSRPLPADVLAELERKTSQLDGIQTLWISQREQLDKLAVLIGRSQGVMLMEPSMRRAFLENIRFDVPWDAEVKEGLSLASLEVSAAERFALRMMRSIPHWLLRLGQARRTFAVSGQKLMQSASGVCIIVGDDGTPVSEILAGRSAQRAWLALTELGLAAQPMMSLAILESVLCRGKKETLDSLGRNETEALVREYHALIPQINCRSTAFLMRFGYAASPSVRTVRLPLDANTRYAGVQCRSTKLDSNGKR